MRQQDGFALARRLIDFMERGSCRMDCSRQTSSATSRYPNGGFRPKASMEWSRCERPTIQGQERFRAGDVMRLRSGVCLSSRNCGNRTARTGIRVKWCERMPHRGNLGVLRVLHRGLGCGLSGEARRKCKADSSIGIACCVHTHPALPADVTAAASLARAGGHGPWAARGGPSLGALDYSERSNP